MTLEHRDVHPMHGRMMADHMTVKHHNGEHFDAPADGCPICARYDGPAADTMAEQRGER